MNSESDKKKKVLFVITKGNWGGAQKYVYDLATNLPNDQFEPVVALGEGDVLEHKLAEKNIRTIKLLRSKRDINFLRDLSLLFDLIHLIGTEKPNLVHLNSSKIGGLGALAVRLHNLKIKIFSWLPGLRAKHPPYTKSVFTAHGWAFNEERSDWQKTIIGLSHWLTVILAHQTICVARREYGQMAAWPGTRNKMSVIHNGVTSTPFLTREEARLRLRSLLHPEQKLKPTDYWIGTIAELHKNKGLDFLIESISQLSQSEKYPGVFIIGEGEERTDLEKLIAEKNLNDQVFLVGEQSNAKQYLKAFDLFILPSRKEGLPFALLEAGEAGIPVIASRVGGIPEVITEDTGILVGVGNIKEITLALDKLMTDEQHSQQLASNLKTKIEQEFSLEQMLEKTINLY